MQLRFTELKGLEPALPTQSVKPAPVSTFLLHQRLWTCSELLLAALCAILLCLFGFLRTLDESLPFVHKGPAAYLNMAAPFVYATAFGISALHYAFLTQPRASATLKHIDVSSMALVLAYMSTLLIVDAATQPTPQRALMSGFRVTAWLDAPAAASVFILVLFLSRSFTPSALTSTLEVRHSLEKTDAPSDKVSLLEWHASLESAVLSTDQLSEPTPEPSNELRLESEQLLRLARASGLVNAPGPPVTPLDLAPPPTLSPPLATRPKEEPPRPLPASLIINGVDARSSHAHFDSGWDWVRQCLLGVLIVSWINQLALLTEGLRVRADRVPPDVVLTQSMSSIALLFSAYFQFVHCPNPIYLLGPILWRVVAFLGVVLTMVASDVMLLPWQATL